ncbi:hypothetical protein BLA29_010817, partial [Euroglyphus maynei]
FDEEDVFAEDEQNKINDDDEEDHVNTTTTTVKTITNFNTNNGTIFDPFQTINDDDPNYSSKRSSIEQNQQQQQQRKSSSTNDEENVPKIASSKAKELFHSSMNEIELLATANRQVQSSLTNTGDSPISPTDLLMAPLKIEPYSSDLSDLSDISPSNIVANDVRSAFDAYTGESSINTNTIDVIYLLLN